MSGARKRWMRRGGFVAAFLIVAAAWTWGPTALRDVEAFRVRQVEVVGTRFLEPYTVVRAAGLDRGASIFDNAASWRSGVRTLALIEDVRIRRFYPSRVVVEVRESEPVALVSAGSLRPVDASGRLLELDPAGTALDLPVVTGVRVRGRRVATGSATSAIATLAALVQREPDVADRVSQAALEGDALRLTFRDADPYALLPAAARGVEMTQLRLALADLAARGELGAVRTIDVRFRDQVVVSFLDKP